MLVILLIVAFIVYIGLYFFWQTAEPYLEGPAPAASILLESLLMPQSLIFVLLRGLMLIIFFYLVADALMSWNKRRQLKKRKAEEAGPRSS